MYLIKVYNYSFQSKENFQFLLDEMMMKAILLEYEINTRLIDYTNQYIYYIFFTKPQYSFTIRFFIDKKTNIVKFIHTTYQIPRQHIKHQKEEINFTKPLQEINQNL